MTTRAIPLAPELADTAGADVLELGAELLGLRVAEREAVPASIPWDSLIEQHGRRVVVTLLGRGIPLERAKELADDAWVRIIQQHRAGRLPELRIPGIVIMQALFLARDVQRQQMRRAAVDARFAPDLGGGLGEDVEQRMLAREQLRRIAKVVEAASPSARRVFELSYGENSVPAPEIAEQLGISLQRVRQIGCELRKRIRAVVGEPGGGDD
ncbi:MAG: sigma-70 family RNA polymerase sigma factor [Deltaproteobacteria bacterium]|nr:sigma-70 family RNA polymerase sigma factor [Nannocystaceae bacterium]